MRWFSTRDLLDIAGVPFAVAGRPPDATGDARLLPRRRRALRRPRRPARRDDRARRVAPRPAEACDVEAVGPRRAVGGSRRPRRSSRRASFTIPIGSTVPGCRPAPRPRALRLGLSLPRPRRRRRGREELGRRGGARSLPPRRARDARPPRRRPLRARQVLDPAGPRESDRRRRDPRAVLARASLAIEDGRACRVATPRGRGRRRRADAVFPLIGYEPDFALFERCGIRLEGDRRVPAHDPETLESNVPGRLSGRRDPGRHGRSGRIFIENSRHHAARDRRRDRQAPRAPAPA